MNKLTQNQGTAVLPKIRKVLMKYNFAMLMAFQLMFFSCTKDKVVADLSTPKVQNLDALKDSNVSDEDVFRSVIFLRGPVADALGEFTHMSIDNVITDPTELANAKAMQEDIIIAINQADPNFMANFRAKITSGDYDQVEQALKNAAEKMYEIGPGLSGYSVSELNTMSTDFIDAGALDENSALADVVDAVENNVTGRQACIAIVLVLAVVVVFVLVIPFADATNIDSYLKQEFKSTVATELQGA